MTTSSSIAAQAAKRVSEYVILKHLFGFPNVRLYEGSWAEYAIYPELKIETGAGK